MGTRMADGFTIIETMLFLAISGVLILAMIGGTGASLNIQRYRDGVESFKSLLQQQYSDLNSIQNGRSTAWTCDTNAASINDGANNTLPGQTNCFLVGKYVRIDQGSIGIYDVLAYQKSTVPQADDIASLKNNYALNASAAQVENHTMEWGTQIAWPASGAGSQSPTTPRTMGLLILRSPDSGLIYTFSSDYIPAATSISQATFTNLLVGGNVIPGQGARTICVGSSGLFVKGDQAVYIAPFAASTTSIEVRSNDYLTSIGQTTQC